MEKILVAEDEHETLRALEKVLSKEGFSVALAADGYEALEKLQTEHFDVMVSDLRMPGIDGIGLLQKAKEIHEDIIFIVITAYATVDDAVEAMRLGSFDYVSKPFAPSDLITSIRNGLAERLRDLVDEKPEAIGSSPTLHHQAGHSWASVQPDGTALIGADAAFYEEAGEIVSCMLPLEGITVAKGENCVTTTDASGRICTVFRSPLSGTVIDINKRLESQPWEARTSPYGENWLFRIIPSRLDEEGRSTACGTEKEVSNA